MKRLKEISVVCVLCFLAIGSINLVQSQVFSIPNDFVKKQTTGAIGTVQDTIRRVATDGRRILGAANVINGYLPDTLWSITGTAVDTSRVFRVKSGRITFGFKFDNDSTDIKFKALAAQENPLLGNFFPGLTDFTVVDSFTVSSSAKAKWVYTSGGSNRPNWDFLYLAATGGGDNNKDAANTGTVIVSY